MDPVLQTFQQQQGGSAEGQGFGNFFVHGRQLNLSSQHLALQKKAEERAQKEQDALLPLQKQLLQYKAINDGLTLGKIVTDADVITEMNSGIPKVNDLLARFMRSSEGFNDSALLSEYTTLFSQNPWLFSAGNGQKVTQGIEAARAQRTMWVSALEHEKELKDRGLYLRDFVTGQGPSRTEVSLGLRDDEIRRLRLQNQRQSLLQQQEQMRLRGNDQALRQIDQMLRANAAGQEIEGLPTPSFNPNPVNISGGNVPNETILVPSNPTATVSEPGVGPDALQPSTISQPVTSTTNAPISLKKVDRPLTASQEGILKETAAYAVDTAKRIEDIKGSAENIFGPAAALGEIVVDKALSNIAPELMNKERVRGREAAKYIKEGIYRSLNKGQGVLSNKDVERLNELYPALKGLDQALESPARAKVVLSSLQQQIAQDAYAKTRLRGLRSDVEALSYLPPKFIKQEFEAGRLTEAEARAAINSSPYKDEINEEIARGRK